MSTLSIIGIVAAVAVIGIIAWAIYMFIMFKFAKQFIDAVLQALGGDLYKK